MADMDVSHGFHVFPDGNAWCAVGPHFNNIQVSTCGFGPTPEDAVDAWRAAAQGEHWWQDKPIPQFDKFTVHG